MCHAPGGCAVLVPPQRSAPIEASLISGGGGGTGRQQGQTMEWGDRAVAEGRFGIIIGMGALLRLCPPVALVRWKVIQHPEYDRPQNCCPAATGHSRYACASRHE